MSVQRAPLEPLIPGLPDDVARQCLLRFPVGLHASCKKVSKRWNSIFKTKRRFSTLRKRFLFQDPRLFILAVDIPTEMIHVQVLDLVTLSWTTRHVTPDLYFGLGCLRSASIPCQGVLFVFGGVSCFGTRDNVFLKYDVRENRWTIIKAMTGAVGSLSAGAVDGKVYVTGPDRELSDGEHDPVEVFDPKKGTWKPVPNYPRRAHSEEFHSMTVFGGRLLLTYRDEPMMGLIYDPKAEKWEDMAGGLAKGLRDGPAVEMHGHLFVLAPKDRSGLRVYDAENDRWDSVGGNALHEFVDSTSRVCSWDSKIYVVKDFLGVIVGNVSKIASCCKSTKSRFRVQWEMVVDGPRGFNGSLLTLCAQVLIG